MTGNSKAAKERRIARTKERGQYRYDNMTGEEKAAYVEKFGAPPPMDVKLSGVLAARSPERMEAYRKWGAQGPGQTPYVPGKKRMRFVG